MLKLLKLHSFFVNLQGKGVRLLVVLEKKNRIVRSLGQEGNRIDRRCQGKGMDTGYLHQRNLCKLLVEMNLN